MVHISNSLIIIERVGGIKLILILWLFLVKDDGFVLLLGPSYLISSHWLLLYITRWCLQWRMVAQLLQALSLFSFKPIVWLECLIITLGMIKGSTKRLLRWSRVKIVPIKSCLLTNFHVLWNRLYGSLLLDLRLFFIAF